MGHEVRGCYKGLCRAERGMVGAGSLFCRRLEKPRRFPRKMLCLAMPKSHPIPWAAIGIQVQVLPDPSQKPALVRSSDLAGFNYC